MQWKIDGTATVTIMCEKAAAGARHRVTAESAIPEGYKVIGYALDDDDAKRMAHDWLRRHAPENIAARWVRTLGLGFHPDTRGADYLPKLTVSQVRRYDADMRTLFRWAKDPYAIGLAAMKRQNLLPSQPGTRATDAEIEQRERDNITNGESDE